MNITTNSSVLLQRGLYPTEEFRVVEKCGHHVYISANPEVILYIDKALSQISKWISEGKVSKIVLAIISKYTREVLERWEFDILPCEPSEDSKHSEGNDVEPHIKSSNSSITTTLRQITASINLLPLLQEPCTFNILAHIERNADVPSSWIDSDPKLITENNQKVRLRSFSTGTYQVDSLVEYRMLDPAYRQM